MMRFLFVCMFFFVSVYGSEMSQKSSIVYFDTPDWYLLEHNMSLKYQRIPYLSKKRQKVKFFETIEYHVGSQKKHVFAVKHPKRVQSIQEKHPLLSLIKREERERFVQLLEHNGIHTPMRLKYVLQTTVSQKTYAQAFALEQDKNPFFWLQFHYPYLTNLLYSFSLSLIGFLIIFFLLKTKKH